MTTKKPLSFFPKKPVKDKKKFDTEELAKQPHHTWQASAP